MRWFRLAADQGYSLAQFMLGNMYYNGSGIPRDYTKAMQWYSVAANQNYAPAQNNLGVMYLQGHGAPQDYVRAYMWLNLARAATKRRHTIVICSQGT
jgi:TPR repeat protein